MVPPFWSLKKVDPFRSWLTRSAVSNVWKIRCPIVTDFCENIDQLVTKLITREQFRLTRKNTVVVLVRTDTTAMNHYRQGSTTEMFLQDVTYF